jgi:hypothetical protein
MLPATSSRSTSITASGQTMAHIAQPVQSISAHWAGKYPFLFDFLQTAMPFLGHTTMQSPQPLHRSELIFIFPAIYLLRTRLHNVQYNARF